MEPKLLLSLAASILGGLLNNAPQSLPTPRQPTPPAIEHRLQVPSFVTDVPSGHFAGVSAPCYTLAEARKSSIDDVVRQILGAVSAEYSHQYLDSVSGNVRNPVRHVDDRLTRVAKGVVLGVERGIVASSWSQEASGRYVHFILVRYPDNLVSEMRRLSRGAKVVARAVRTGEGVTLALTEVNGVEVVLSSVDVAVRRVNRHAAFLSYYVCKVHAGSEERFSQAITPVRICGSSASVRVMLPANEKGLSDYLLGADIDVQAVVKGHDEIGRLVAAKVEL